MQELDLEAFLKADGPILDVRSPSEYLQGHIPDAYNLPLFSDEERALVGTMYKNEGKEKAVELGLQFIGPKLHPLVMEAKAKGASHVRVHCWRGGMRSRSVAWLLETAGLQVTILTGGYKSFRHFVLEESFPYSFKVLGGLTGSGKTTKLHEMRAVGEQVLDLEGLANHRGSSYGMIGMPKQPSNEQFDNSIVFELHHFSKERPIWVEDESQLVGTCKIPDTLFIKMRESPLFVLERTVEERLDNLMQDYSQGPVDELIAATQRLKKRLGSARTQEAIDFIESGHIRDAMRIVLAYYDSTYEYGLSKRKIAGIV